jgi:hypothetical protein
MCKQIQKVTLWKTKLHNPLPDLLIITGPSIPGSSTAIRLPRRHRSHLVNVVSQIFSSVASLIVSSFANLSPVSLYKSNQQPKKKKRKTDQMVTSSCLHLSKLKITRYISHSLLTFDKNLFFNFLRQFISIKRQKKNNIFLYLFDYLIIFQFKKFHRTFKNENVSVRKK